MVGPLVVDFVDREGKKKVGLDSRGEFGFIDQR